MNTTVKSRRSYDLKTPTGLGTDATKEIGAAATVLLADIFTLYVKTKNFHWHMSGPHFRNYHLMLDDQGVEILEMTDPLAERVQALGACTIKSVGDISRQQRLKDNDADFVHPHEMLAELRQDNATLVASLRTMHDLCDEHGDRATASLLENWIDESEKRVWFLFETLRGTNG